MMMSFEEFTDRFKNKEICVLSNHGYFKHVFYYEYSRVYGNNGERKAITPYSVSDLYANCRYHPENWIVMSIEYVDFFGCASKRCV